MFDLNFKENLEKVIADEVSDLVENQVGNLLNVEEDTESALIAGGPLHTDKYDELIELIHETSKNHVVVQKQEGKNLFAASSVIAIVLTLLTSVLVQIDVALADGEFSTREGIQISITLIGAITSIFARGTEGNQGIWTPRGVPGLDKEFYDLNNNGIDDRLE